MPLPMLPPYDKVHFLAAGGSSKDRARVGTPASAKAHVVEVGPDWAVQRGSQSRCYWRRML